MNRAALNAFIKASFEALLQEVVRGSDELTCLSQHHHPQKQSLR